MTKSTFKIYPDIIQQTDAWFELKDEKVGGSTLSDVMTNQSKPVEENAIFFRLLGERMEEFEIEEGGYTSNAMENGNIYESEAADLLERVYGKKCFEIGWAQINDFVGISPDRLLGEISENVEEAAEFKCPEKTMYARYVCNNKLMLDNNVWQIIDYFLVFKNLKTLYFMAYRKRNKILSHVLYKVKRDTIINISKTKAYPVSELVTMAEKRTGELKTALDNKIESLKTPKF